MFFVEGGGSMAKLEYQTWNVVKVKSDHCSKFSNLSNSKEEAWKISGLQAIGRKKPEKYQGFNGIQTLDLCDTGAMLNQLSCEATH